MGKGLNQSVQGLRVKSTGERGEIWSHVLKKKYYSPESPSSPESPPKSLGIRPWEMELAGDDGKPSVTGSKTSGKKSKEEAWIGWVGGWTNDLREKLKDRQTDKQTNR